MNKHVDNRGDSGFSMVEALAAVAVLVILLSLSAVGVSYYRDLLKITELDNAAREIYMAAENRAVLLGSGGQLEDILSGASTLADGRADGSSSQVVKREDEAAALGLLTAGAVDPALLEGCFYIVYDSASGAVTDVFYTEGPDIQEIGYAFSIAGDRDKRMRPDSGPMLGYYGGEHTARMDYSPLPAPEVMVVIRNEERLMVDVTFTVPKAARDLMGPALEQGAARKVTLDYQGTEIVLLDTAAGQSPFSGRMERPLGTGSLAGGSVKYTWVLDALEDGKRFHELFSGSGVSGFGKDFTVTAEIVLSADGRRSTSASGSDTDNSLFAEHSGGDTARLENLRHLQNLDAGTSKAEGKKAAVQLADIHCYDNDAYPDYVFTPIVNKELTSFDGGWDTGHERNQILALHVTSASAAGKSGAGLFASAEDRMTFTGVRLIGAEVAAGGASQPAGALIGKAQNGLTAADVWVVNASVSSASAPAGGIAGSAAGVSAIKSCRVYWEPEAGQDNLRPSLGSDKDGYQYKISGTCAGGLVGNQEKRGTGTSSLGSITVSSSLAAITIYGTERAAGLIGYSESTPITLTASYADCYLKGSAAAGLIGHMTTVTQMTNCYAAGFIDMDTAQKAAGLCLGSGAITAANTYSVMSYPGDISGKTIFRLDEDQRNSGYTDTYFLGGEGDSFVQADGTERRPSSYDEMTAQGFADKMGSAFVFKGYRTQTEREGTYPYNLQEKQNLTAYSFPGLAALPHYGDWQAYFKEPSLVYYEEYEDGTRGFSGGNARHLIGQLDDSVITSDGYAVALLRSDLTDIDAFEIVYTYLEDTGSGFKKAEQTVSYQKDALLSASWTRMEGANPVKEEYYLAPLPEELVIGDRTTEAFYQYLRFEIEEPLTSTQSEFPSGEFFYGPHFAETVKPYAPADGLPLVDWTDASAGSEGPEEIAAYIQTLSPKGSTVSVSIRTPRHLYDLSMYKDYYNNGQRVLAFRQELDLDYQDYTGHGFASLPKEGGSKYTLQSPIGTQAAPFRGSYDGGCRSIEHVVFSLTDSTRVCMGLFGSSIGDLSNIVYRLDPEVTFARTFQGKQAYFGVLAGINGGTISNCAVDGVSFKVSAYDSELYIGGLVGVNEHTISNCAAELASLAVDASRHLPAYAGGLAGRNNADIRSSYAVGRLSAKSEEASTPVSLCGFVCQDRGRIRGSYSAMDLEADGAGAEAHGFCDPAYGVGSQTGSFYLNKGNFTYRGAYFLADYDQAVNGAEPFTYQGATVPGSVPGMSMCTAEGAFPYPTGVTDGAGEPVHYGLWPEPMDLGDMGAYYWEELYLGGKSTYHISLLAIDPGADADAQKTVSKPFTLSTAYNSGGEVRRYGYGFYNEAGHSVTLVDEDTKDLFYADGSSKGTPFTEALYKQLEAKKRADPEDPDRKVDEELAALMKGFEFHSFHSFGLDQEEGGLYPGCTGKDPNAALTLEQSGTQTLKVTFFLDPHFADALAVKQPDDAAKWIRKDGVEFVKDDPSLLPGGKDAPFEVRSIAQLQLINWNKTNRDTSTVIWDKYTGATDVIQNFPYLSSSGDTGKYHWKQSFDILGEQDGDGGYKTYSPIAEYYDSTNWKVGNLSGWFSGDYDGCGYMIENVSIEGHRLSSCAGLFGVVYDGSLENIALYSSDGRGTISTLAGTGDKTQSRWFAMGSLAGVAGTSDPTKNAIRNCSASGYTLDAQVYTYGTGSDDWGGNNIGGLVGASHMNLSNCSSVVDIDVHDAVENDNMRVGGLAGICQGSLTNCYAGGQIRLDRETVSLKRPDRGIYVGGLVGGSYMKPLQIAGDPGKTIGFVNDPGKNEWSNGKKYSEGYVDNTLTNCYSYVRLPALAGERHDTGKQEHFVIRGLFAVGGAGEIEPTGDANNHGTSTRKNCYYLASETLADIEGGAEAVRSAKVKTDLGANDSENTGITALRYEQLMGSAEIQAKDGRTGKIYQLLNDKSDLTEEQARKEGPFYPVSDTAIGAGIPVPGKYSYPPDTSPALGDQDISPALKGTDYPFPTILRKEVEGEGTYRVHYGRWPLNGFSRMSMDGKTHLGGTPILIDLFGGGPHTEKLVLKSVAPGGEWSYPQDGANATDPSIAKVEIAPAGPEAAGAAEFTLTVTGVSEGTTPLELTYTKDGIQYSILVSIHVNVGIKLLPSTVFLFPDDTVTVGMSPVNSEGRPLKDQAGQDIPGELELTDPHPISYLSAEAVQPDGGSARDALRFTTSGAPQGATAVSAEFTYTVDPGDPDRKKGYKDFSLIQVQILPLPEAAFTTETVTGEDGEATERTVCTIVFDDRSVTAGTAEDTLRSLIADARFTDGQTGLDGIRIDWSRDEGGAANGNWIKLTYPEGDVPEARLTVTLTMTSGDGALIPEAQTHELTLTVSKPAEDRPEGQSMALPDALPPAGGDPDIRTRRRRAGDRRS